MQTEKTYAMLKEETEMLRQENEMLKKQAMGYRMAQAISDDQLSRHIMAEMDSYFGPERYPWFVCILFHGGKPDKKMVVNKSPLEMVKDTYAPTLDPFGVPFFFETVGTVVCLLNAELPQDHQDSQQAGRAFCTRLQEALAQQYRNTGEETNLSHISISHISKMEGGPRMLYRSAVSVAEHRTANSEAVCMEGEWTPRENACADRAFTLELAFWSQIQARAFFDAAVTLDQLIDASSFQQGSLERTLASVFSRMELVLSILSQDTQGMRLDQSAVSHLLAEFSQVKTYQEMREISYDILATMEDLFVTPKNARNKKMIAIERYIQQNYYDQNLGAASLSEEFRISTSYLSRIFKADMGMGVVDYIHRVRIDAARELLLTTELPLEEIAEKSGFSNRWSFMRVFKNMVGTTPGAFRTHTAD